MSAGEALPIDFDMPEEERVALLYRAGELRFKQQRHQLEKYDRVREWNVRRQTREHRKWCASIGARFDRMWVDRSARRTGKTCFWLLVGEEECIRFYTREGRGANGMIAIPTQKKIGTVLVPNIEKVFRDAPEGYRPEYRSSGNGHHEHLYIPAVEARIKLVGLDMHPDALRGPFLDFCIVTEAGFVRGLESTLVSEVMLQFQGLPHAWIALESSEPKQKDHDFNREFRPDAEARGAFSSMTIENNTSLTPEDIEDEIRQCGGRNSATCKRELFNENDPDPETMIVPEFDESVHVVDPKVWLRPTHALAFVGMDPGKTDPFGLVWMYLDWLRQCIVVEAAWMKPNASTGEVSSVCKSMEQELWGTAHRAVAEPTKRELTIEDVTRAAGGGEVWEAGPGSLTYWEPEARSLVANPYSRVSDVATRFIMDMNVDYGMNVRMAQKGDGSAEADEQHLRMLFAARPLKIVILKNGKTEPLIQQLRSGMWRTDENGKKIDWSRSRLLGHEDCIAALKYVVRDVRWTRSPFPPAIECIDRNQPDRARHMLSAREQTGVGSYNMFGDREWR